MANIIEMPKLSDTMSVGTLVAWLKKEGDEVTAGDMIAEVETDKATMEVEAFDDGYMLKHYIKEGQEVPIGAPICAIGEEGESAPKADSQSSSQPKKEKKEDDGDKEEARKPKEEKTDEGDEKKEKKEKEESAPEKPSKREGARVERSGKSEERPVAEGERVKSSPLARRIAEDLGIDLSAVKGSGPGGRIVKEDVRKAEEEGRGKKTTEAAPSPSPASDVPSDQDEEIPVSNMRAAIARALIKSKTEAPHFYLQTEVDAQALVQLRESLNDRLADLPPEQGGIKFSVNDLILKAAAEAVQRVPSINRSWQGDKIIRYASVNLGFAVAVPEGLITPVIRNAAKKSLRQISSESRDLAVRARSKKIKPDEMQGSTLTVTNLGMFGITDFYGIINPPNAAIISVGATVKTPVVDANGEIVVGYRMRVGLSGDHRSIDGAVGAQYLAALREILETPAVMLV